MTDSNSESFADLFAKTEVPGKTARRWNIGDEVEGVVAHVGDDTVFVDLDAKQQAWFDRTEVPDAELGQTLKGRVVMLDEGSDALKLARSFGKDAGRQELQIAFDDQVPVEGKVTGVNKGGAEVEVAGMRGFCPFSQLDKRYIEDPSEFIGRTLSFLVQELKDRDVVLSRRKLLEQEDRENRLAIMGKLQVGSTMQGRVTQIRDFGAFVDLGGIEGLLPVRELSHDRVQRAQDVVSVGDVVTTKITKLEPDGEKLRITLSLKALATDPWDGVQTTAPIGKVLAGQVTRLTDFGAFVRLGHGIEGLLHVSEIGTRVSHASEVLEVGQQLLVIARAIDAGRRRISLTLAEDGANVGDVGANIKPILGALVKATVEKHENFGVFVQVEGTRGRGGRGLIPMAELGLARGVDLRRELPIDTTITAKVVDATDGRMRLSIRAAKEDAERAVYDNFKQEQASKGSMGTFGDLLRKKLEKK